MNSTIKGLLLFVSGIAVGVAATYETLKTKFEAQADTEIESVKERFHEKMRDAEEKVESTSNLYTEASDALKRYSGYSKEKNDIKENEKMDVIYVIPPEEFSELEDYSVKSLTYWTDGVVTDEEGKEVDIDNVIGKDSLEHFGEYEEDCVYVRNDDLHTDFEILRDYRAYSDVCR